MSYQCPRTCENKTEYGYCKTTYCINPQFSNLGTWQQTILQHGTLKLNPQTNADRIRGMSDEELAEWLERIRLCCATDLCGRICPFAEVCYSNAEAPKETLDWLRQEVET